jgi:hypothetical protein
LSVSSSGGGSVVAGLVGTALASSAVLSISPGSRDFGTVVGAGHRAVPGLDHRHHGHRLAQRGRHRERGLPHQQQRLHGNAGARSSCVVGIGLSATIAGLKTAQLTVSSSQGGSVVANRPGQRPTPEFR